MQQRACRPHLCHMQHLRLHLHRLLPILVRVLDFQPEVALFWLHGLHMLSKLLDSLAKGLQGVTRLQLHMLR